MLKRLPATFRTLWDIPDFRRRPLTSSVRVLVWGARRRLGRQQKQYIAESHGVQLALAGDNWSWNRFVFQERRPTDPELLWLRKQLGPGMVMMDVGAHFGVWTAVIASALKPTGKVLAFEPTPSTMEILSATVKLNRLENVILYRTAVSDISGNAVLHINEGSSDMNTLGKAVGRMENVEVVTLDEVVASSEIQRVDAIKIDTEGNEERVIAGATQVLKGHRPIVVFETNDRYARLNDLAPDGAWKRLTDLNYQMYVVAPDQQLVEVQEFVAPSAAGRTYQNIIALPAEVRGSANRVSAMRK